MTTPTTPTAQRYEAARQPLATLIETVPDDRWDAPSPCEGWAARDVVAHLIDTQRGFLAGHGLDLGRAPDVSADPACAWAEHTAVIRPILDDPAVVERSFDGYFGPTTIGEAIVRFYVADMVGHRWDIARSVGGDERFTDGEIEQLEADLDGYGPVAYTEGVFKPALDPPAGADRQTRLLARMGRRA